MVDNSANNKRIAKNTLFLYGRMIFVLLVSLYTTRVVLNSLGVVDFGIYNVVAGFVTMFAFLNTSMTNGIQRFFNYTMGKEGTKGLTKIYNTSLQIQILVAVVILFLLETIGLWYLYNKMVLPEERFGTALWLYQFSVISLLLVIIQVPYSAAVLAHEKMDYYALVSIIDAVAKLIIALLLPFIGSDKLMIYGIYNLIVSIVNFALYFIYSKCSFEEIVFKFSFYKGIFISMLTFSGWNIFGTFAYMLKTHGLTVLLNAFFGASINAAQGVAAQIQSAIQGFSGNIVAAFRPQMVQSYASDDFARVRSMFYSLSKISYILLYMLSVPVVYEIDYILKLWLGSSIPDYTAYFTALVLANMVLSSLHTPIVTIIHASGQMRKFQFVTCLIICSILPISWFFLKIGYNPATVYWVSLAIQLLNQIACLIVLKDVFSYKMSQYFEKVVIPITVISFAVPLCIYVVWSFMDISFIRLIIVCIISAVSTSLLTYLTSTNSEKEIIKKVLNKKLKK